MTSSERPSPEIDLKVLDSPRLFRMGGRSQLMLEVVVAVPADGQTVQLESVLFGDVIDGAELARRALELKPDVARASGLQRKPSSGALAPGTRTALYLAASYTLEAPTPSHVEVELRVAGVSKAFHRSIPVVASAPIEIAAPVLGPGWFTFMAPTNDSAHRRSIHEVGGSLFLAQRYAVDLVRTDESGERFIGDPGVNKSYSAYGSPVVAVADGVVRSVRSDIPENTPGACLTRATTDEPCKLQTAVPITRDTLAGNHVVLELAGGGGFAVYAHLIPGSVPVRIGEKVTSGQMLGRVGNSGNASEPHLHFHLCDAASVTACSGLPFHVQKFIEIPIDPRRGPIAPPRLVVNELPADSAVIHFPDGSGKLPSGR